jgi:hypothetical protein
MFCLMAVCCSCSDIVKTTDRHALGDICMTRGEFIFQLLSQNEVQSDLVLSANQRAGILEISAKPFQEIPHISNMLVSARSAKNQFEHAEQIHHAGEVIDRYRLESALHLLDPLQFERLWQIVGQIEGSVTFLYNTDAQKYVGLSNEQMLSIRSGYDSRSKKRLETSQRLGRQMIAGIGPGESVVQREAEIQRLSQKIQAIDFDINKSLLAVLSTDQKEKWNAFLGRPLTIEWKAGGEPLRMY